MKKTYFKSAYNEFVYLRTYARWIPEKQRREQWPETVDRYMNFMRENLGPKLSDQEYDELREAILTMEVMPSMRLMQFAGDACRRDNAAAYNCSFLAPEKWQDLSVILYLLMVGTGVGFSVTEENVGKFPKIAKQTGAAPKNFFIPDSKEGWAEAFLAGLTAWAEGEDIVFDYSALRPAGARLKTFGGYSSGPEPLRRLLEFAKYKVLAKQGARLSALELHDIICKIAEIVVCGGVRRSALISLSDLGDMEMRDAKKGMFWETEPQRALANNSAVYKTKPTATEFLEEFLTLMQSGTGERGIFNVGSLEQTLPQRRLNYFAASGTEGSYLGTNPCGEIILRAKNGGGQMCNLTEVICRPEDTRSTLLRKVRLATVLGTYQSTLTNFSFLPKAWAENCEAERLLGVSLTGQMDCPAIREEGTLQVLKEGAICINEVYAADMGIDPSTCITCVKPSGTVSQVVGCSSGLHAAFAPYYIRRVRITVNDPLLALAKAQGVPCFPEVGQNAETATSWVLEFPQQAPDGAVLVKDLDAMAQLSHWKKVKENFTEHNPSVTVYVKPSEWVKVAYWVYENWDMVGGLSFLPVSEHVYQLAPYEEITRKEFLARTEALKNFDLSQLSLYEHTDHTEQKHEMACVGGSCELF